MTINTDITAAEIVEDVSAYAEKLHAIESALRPIADAGGSQAAQRAINAAYAAAVSEVTASVLDPFGKSVVGAGIVYFARRDAQDNYSATRDGIAVQAWRSIVEAANGKNATSDVFWKSFFGRMNEHFFADSE